MRGMKRVFAVVLALCFVMALTGCTPRTGKYRLTSMLLNGQDYLFMLREMSALTGQELEDPGYLEIIDDKNAILVSADESEEALTYDSTYFYATTDGSKIEYEYNAITNTITLSYEEEGTSVVMKYKK